MADDETKETKILTCDVCNKSFKTKYFLNVHKRIQSGENPYKCDACNKSFNQKSHLTQHTLVHSGIKQFQCDVCNKSFYQTFN